MTYQEVMKSTGASRALVVQCKKAIIGNRHHCDRQELYDIIRLIREEQANESIDKSKRNI